MTRMKSRASARQSAVRRAAASVTVALATLLLSSSVAFAEIERFFPSLYGSDGGITSSEIANWVEGKSQSGVKVVAYVNSHGWEPNHGHPKGSPWGAGESCMPAVEKVATSVQIQQKDMQKLYDAKGQVNEQQEIEKDVRLLIAIVNDIKAGNVVVLGWCHSLDYLQHLEREYEIKEEIRKGLFNQ
jgi:hypothetical protein